MKRLLLIAVLFFSCSQAFAQLFPFRSYSIEKGLSEAVVNDLMQDHEGYLWIATGYGLNRFDGIQFRNYYEENGLLNNKIYSLYQDEENTIWVGTGGGVNIIEDDSIMTHPDLSPLDSAVVLEIYQDDIGEYWFATDGQGVWHYDSYGQLYHYGVADGLADDRVRDILQDDQGTFWFATREGLTRMLNGTLSSYTVDHGLPDNKLRDMVLDGQGNLWLATRGGLSRMSEGSFINYTQEDGLINNRIQSLSLDGQGGLWAGTEEGISHFSEGEFSNYTVQHGLANNIIYSTLRDRENNIWFGTFGGGISVFLGEHIRNYTIEEGLPNNVITSISQDRAGNHWVTTYGGGLSLLSGNTFETYLERDGLVDNKVYTSIVDHMDRLLVGTRWGLSIFEDGRFHNFDETELPYRKIRAIIEDQNREEYWIGTYGEGILNFRDGRFTQLDESDGLANNTVLSVEQGNDGSVWFATYGGASRYLDGEFTNYTIRDGLPNNGVLDILKDSDGTIWASTFGGIARFNGESFEAITGEDGLQDEVCYFLIQDHFGKYWIGTKEGVVRFDYEKFRESDSPREKHKAFKLITQDQGIVANEMNASAAFTDREGILWFGSVGGLVRYDPSRSPQNHAAPKVHIENVLVSGEPVANKGDLRIGSDNHNITFDFIGISLTAPEQVVYEYRLRGSGESWQKTEQRSVRYSALLPGDYRFEVRARNNDGIWSEERASLSFTVMPPFWLQWWFIIMVVAVLVGIIAFIYNYYRVRKMVEIERMRVRIASDLHDDVGSALTEIALQSDFLQTTDVGSELRQSLNQIGSQSRKIVSSLDDIVWSIDARNDTLGDLTDRMQDYINNVLPQKEVTYYFEELDMDEKLTVQMKENLYLIFKEAVNNIAKHSDASKVEVILKNQNSSFDLLVRDNGSGVKPVKKTGHGLRNIEMRAKRIDAEVEFENETGFTVHVSGKGM